MRPVPFVLVTDMDRSIEWYGTVLGSASVLTASPYWSELEIGGAVLALHRADQIQPGGAAGIAFVVEEPLEALVVRLADSGIEAARGIEAEPFGRSMVLEDPDGFRFQVNEYGA